MRSLLSYLLAAFLVTASAYTPYEPGCDGVGALGGPVLPELTMAVSRDLRALLGRWVRVEGVGVRYVNDVMAARWSRKIDLCVGSEVMADDWGVRTVKVRVVE